MVIGVRRTCMIFGRGLGCIGLEGYHPQSSFAALCSCHDYSPSVLDGDVYLGESDFAPRVTQCDDGEEGVRGEAGEDVPRSCFCWELWEVERASLGGFDLVSVGERDCDLLRVAVDRLDMCSRH